MSNGFTQRSAIENVTLLISLLSLSPRTLQTADDILFLFLFCVLVSVSLTVEKCQMHFNGAFTMDLFIENNS